MWWQELSAEVALKIYNSAWNAAQNRLLSNSLRELIKSGNITLEELVACAPGYESHVYGLAKAGLSTFSPVGWSLARPTEEPKEGWERIDTFPARTRVVRPFLSCQDT